MPPQSFEFHRRALAKSARQICGPFLHWRDDRRRTTVIVDSLKCPADVLELLERREFDSLPPEQHSQMTLTVRERARLPFGRDRCNVFHARSCKGIAELFGRLSGWIDYYDRTLTVDEHYAVYDPGESGPNAGVMLDRAAEREQLLRTNS